MDTLAAASQVGFEPGEYSFRNAIVEKLGQEPLVPNPYQKPCSGRKSRRGQTVQSHERLRSDGLVGPAEAQYHHVGGNRIGGSGGGGGCVGRDESRRFFLGFLRLC